MSTRTISSCTNTESEKTGTKVVGVQKWVTITKAWNATEGWMKSTKAMQLPGGVLIQVTTLEVHGLAEALTFVPGLRLEVDEYTGIGVFYPAEVR